MAEEPPFGIEQRPRGDGVLVVVTGGVDMSTVGRFERALKDALALAGDVTLDLSGVTFFGSEGVRALLAGRTGLQAAGRRLEVADASPQARRVLQMSGLA